MDTEKNPRRFEFARDSFAFANELIWEYRPNTATGGMDFRPHTPKPDYAHRCFVLVRTARQFLYHAAFDPSAAPLGDVVYRGKLREVLSRNPRRTCPAGREVVFPGYAGLRDFSAAREKLLKAECGGAWQSYVLRSHWRMVFPISRVHQAWTAGELIDALKRGISPIIHLVKFPALTINHGMIVFNAKETPGGFEFQAYDPNNPAQPASLTYDRATRTFSLPPNRYWPGGALDIIEIYRNWLM
jgi:hypothetical protein